MKISSSIKRATLSLGIIALISVGVATTVQAAGPALRGQVTLRPLTPQEISDYSLTSVQGASGLSTVGVGQPAYLEALVNAAVTNSDITNITWVLTVKPAGSAAVLTASPLGTNVPTYKMADRYTRTGTPEYKVPGTEGRTLLLPDLTGKYTVTVSIKTANSGNTNLTQDITASTYMGINTCAFCHSGGVAAPDKYTTWSQTPHATVFTRSIDGLESDYHSASSILPYTVGYDTNAVNGGFDDVATQVGWTFPTSLVPGNWAALTNKLKSLSNVQCENCHGPGSEHAFGEISAPHSAEAKAAVAVSFAAGDCAQCHDSKPTQYRSAEWNNSQHAVAVRSPSGTGRAACARCHTGGGFAAYTETLGTTNAWTGTNNAYTTYTALTCATCHDPHDASKPHQLRAGHDIALADGATITTVTNAGAGGFCMNCHQSRTGSYTNSLVKYPLGQPTYPGGSSSFGPHDNPAADMLEGVNGYTYGKFIPSAAHASAVTNTCVGCHMQPVASTDPAFTKAGGHTMKMSYPVISGGVTNSAHMVNVCVKCHGSMSSFDMVRQDYDGDGVIQGVQTEVQNLINQLSRLFPNSTYRADGNYVADGLIKSPSTKTNWQAKFLQAAWNWQFVDHDLSKGVHNAPYAVGLLKASISDLTDDADHDGISDKWEIANFGSLVYDGNSDNDNDGAKNSLEISAGTNPLLADSDGDGINDGVEFNAGSNPLNALDKPGFVVKIYTAAEIEFASEIGKRYQVQTVSGITGTWLNVGSVTNGTGNDISMVNSTRSGGGQGYFRVVQVP